MNDTQTASWIHWLDGEPCESGPERPDDALCSAHGRQVQELTRAEREHEVRVCGNCETELGWQEPGPRCTDCEGLRR